MKKYYRLNYILILVLVCALLPFRVEAGYEIPGSCHVQTDTSAAGVIKTLDYGYANNTYLSLRDTAMILRETDKGFSLEITKNAVSVNLGNAYTPVGTENAPWESSENPDLTLRRNDFLVNGQKVYYYTMIYALPAGGYDCFIMAADLAMILDVDIAVPSTGILQINTQTSFGITPAALEQAGYFYGVNSVLVGDATTGEIYYQYQSDTAYPIASTSKLMTCLLAMEAVSAGQISTDQSTVVSEAVCALSVSGDGVIPFEAGQQITVQELLTGALLPSSNECALCLAETIDGSEEAFVRRMNQKAQDLGLSQAFFYNSHGLPAFTQDPVPAKRQNRMSAKDMFQMVSYLLKVYPQIKEITSQQEATLPSLNLEVRNSNPLLRNMSQVTGLKTGTTNKSGACLVTSLAADDGVITHDLVVVVLGTEDSIERGRVSELLARYALQAFASGAGAAVTEPLPQTLPTQAEAAVEWLLQAAKKRDL